jgi:hypothetical protein
MKTIITFLFVIFMAVNSYAGNGEINMKAKNSTSNEIKGKIVDAINGEPLAGVEIILLSTNNKTYSDFDGNFKFENIPSGEQQIRISYISYQEKLEKIDVLKNTTDKIQISLKSVEK